MQLPKLGKLLILKAAEVWGNEPQIFTPWLSQNLELLSEALQIEELELKGTEVSAGDFRLDILAEDGEGFPVIIENQFGATDHKHLGQLISYVASLKNRATVVWVAERFKEDHRAAIDWLNSSTSEDYDFFAVEVEALKIGDSDPAPYFNVVAKPNNWARNVRAVSRQTSTGELASRHHMRISYWASFAEYLRAKNSKFQIRRQNKDHWFEFPIGRSGIVISSTITTKGRIGVELYLHKDPLKAGIRQLKADKTAIEQEFGEALDWQELLGKKASRIAVFKTDSDPSDENSYSELHDWMLDRMERFQRVFGQRVKQLNLELSDTSEDNVDPEDII
ncbi:DUF4268 domain-containing protein [Asticcacaulis sp. BYS171W]|uniref:DUF4268 domain-containing protein n=1 Tax=Asticcacaulis aquaticus TaxID=2984212 RepID=A0ABT5HYD2_9CAUL|nr:DUF4268 domain-containing protein [Asticcacaulis aquaticus]MDC7685090.1 DUF4268 domain-containing protein [Asticcacaulis aquaticus]